MVRVHHGSSTNTINYERSCRPLFLCVRNGPDLLPGVTFPHVEACSIVGIFQFANQRLFRSVRRLENLSSSFFCHRLSPPPRSRLRSTPPGILASIPVSL